MVGLEYCCDHERGREYEDSDRVEYEGEKTIKLWCLTENYLYNYKAPSNPNLFLRNKLVHPYRNLILHKITTNASIIVDFFTLLDSQESTSYKRYEFEL